MRSNNVEMGSRSETKLWFTADSARPAGEIFSRKIDTISKSSLNKQPFLSSSLFRFRFVINIIAWTLLDGGCLIQSPGALIRNVGNNPMPILGCPEHQSWISNCEGHPLQSALLVIMSEQKSWLTRLSESMNVSTCDFNSLYFSKNKQQKGKLSEGNLDRNSWPGYA